MGNGRFARPPLYDNTGVMQLIDEYSPRTRFGDWPLAVKSILGFWVFYALTVVVRAFLGTDPWTTVENKLTIIGFGLVVNALIYVAIAGLTKGATIRRKAVVAAMRQASTTLLRCAAVA